MPRIIYTEQAGRDIARLADFMQTIEPPLKRRVISTILDGIEILQKFPRIARPSQDKRYKQMRELFVAFGKSGYVVLYEYHEAQDIILINAIRHAREAGYNVEE